MRRIAARSVLAGTLLAGGCYGGLDAKLASDEAASEGESGQPNGDDDGGDLPDARCREGERPTAAVPLRRLTRNEYDNTVRDLLGDESRPAAVFPRDEAVAGYFANALAPVSQTQVRHYLDTAEALAAAAVAERLDVVVPCALTDASCPESFVRTFGRRAFRRSLDEDEASHYLALFTSVAAAEDATAGVEAVVAAMLMSPHFLYVATGDEVPALAGVQLASRLSYFVWSSMPDDALLDAAEEGRLDDRDGLEEQVRRMLADPRAVDMLESFHRQWLTIDELEGAFKDPDVFPQWNPGLARSMLDEIRHLLERVVMQEDGRLHTLLTADYGRLTPELAELYDVASPDDSGWASLPAERAGLLTRGAILAQHAHAAEVSWVHRGLLVREQFLCHVLPPPPNDVDTNAANDPDRMDDPACWSCHQSIDPIGQGFDDYDPIGVHLGGGASGHVQGLAGGLDFDGPAALARALADEPTVLGCVATQWFRYAHRRDLDADDACVFEGLQESFAASDGDLRELVVAIATADSFRLP